MHFDMLFILFTCSQIDTLESSDIEKVKWELISKHLVMRSELLTVRRSPKKFDAK